MTTAVLELESGAAGYRISNPPIHLVVPVLGFLEVWQQKQVMVIQTKYDRIKVQ